MFARCIAAIFCIFLVGCVSEPLPEGFERSNDFDQVEAAKTRISLGLTYLKNGNFSQAKINLDKALEFAPRLADAHYSIAYYYQVVEEIARAEESYQNALKLDPRNADIANSYGAFLCQQSRYEEAKTFFLQAVNSQTYASSAETYENMALCSISQQRNGDAIEYLSTALNHQPTRAKSLFLLTELQVGEQQFEQAKQTLTRYQRVARVSADTLWMSIQIENGLGQPGTAKGYGDMLLRMYPRHPLTIKYRDSLSEVTASVTQKPKPDLVAKPVVSESTTTEPVLTATESAADSATETASETVTEIAADVNDVTPQQSTDVQPDASVLDHAVEDHGAEAEPTTESSIVTQTDTPQALQHVVAKGDNLYRISLRYNVKMSRLIDWNQLPENGAIQVGMTLWVSDPTLQSSELEQ